MHRKGWIGAFALVGLALLAPPSDAQKTAREGSPGPALRLGPPSNRPEMFFCETPRVDCRTSASAFELKRTRDLFVFVTWPSVRGDHVQTVEFYLPDGNLYVRKQTSFRTSPGRPRAMQVPGGRVPEPYLTSSRNVPTVVTALPVEGTYITQRSLTGKWSVRVLLDGRLAASAQFTFELPVQSANPGAGKTQTRGEIEKSTNRKGGGQ
jgi:hypothetical protein